MALVALRSPPLRCVAPLGRGHVAAPAFPAAGGLGRSLLFRVVCLNVAAEGSSVCV